MGKWALVLSGGGAKGISHVGVLKALEDMGVPKPSLVVGTSMGAIVGGLYACGMSAKDMARFIIDELAITEYLDSFVFRLEGPLGRIFQAGQILGSLATRPGIDPGQKILRLFERLTGEKTFAETEIPFRCNAVDLVSGQEIIFSSGSVARAMRASMSFPVFFEPLWEGPLCLVDGGLADNMPVDIARLYRRSLKRGERFNRILAVNVERFDPLPPGELKNGPQIAFRSMETALLRLKERRRSEADLTICAVDDTTPFSFFRGRKLIALGEKAVEKSEKALKAFFRGGIKGRLYLRGHRTSGLIEGSAD